MNKKNIVVTIASIDFEFSVAVQDSNNYVNAVMPDNKIAPSYEYLTRTVKPEQKDELVNLLDSVPGLIMDVFTVVSEEARGGITVTLKK